MEFDRDDSIILRGIIDAVRNEAIVPRSHDRGGIGLLISNGNSGENKRKNPKEYVTKEELAKELGILEGKMLVYKEDIMKKFGDEFAKLKNEFKQLEEIVKKNTNMVEKNNELVERLVKAFTNEVNDVQDIKERINQLEK